jgi:hypothetical protein
MKSSVTGIAVLILILHLILDPRNDPRPSKKLRGIEAARLAPGESYMDCTLPHDK